MRRGDPIGERLAKVAADEVNKAARHALYSRRPKAEYLIGTEARMTAALSTLLPHRAVDRLIARQTRGASA